MTEYENIHSPSSSSSSSSSEEECQYVYTFPSTVFEAKDLPELQEMLIWSSSADSMKTQRADAVPVIPFKMECSLEEDKNRIYQRVMFLNLAEDRAALWDRFDRLLDSASLPPHPRTGREDVDWHSLDKRMSKPPRLSHRVCRPRTNKTDGLKRKGNADDRLSFVYRHVFLVKQQVTLGAQTTGADEYHLYQIYRVPLMLYLQISGNRVRDGSFYPGDRKHFKPFLLKPGSVFYVKPDHTYICVSLQKTLFTLTRLTSEAFTELQKIYTLLDAFSTDNVFTALPPSELDHIIVERTKKKRGRPAKSLDKIYWITEKTIKKKKRSVSADSAPPPPIQPTGEETEKLEFLKDPKIDDIFNELMDWSKDFSVTMTEES